MTVPLQNWQCQQERARADALSFLESTPSSAEAVSIMSDTLSHLIESGAPFGHADFFRNDGIPALALRLRNQGLTEWASVLEEASKTASQTIAIGLTAVEILVGRAAGDFCGKSPGDREFVLVRNLRETIAFRSADFLPAAEGPLMSGHDRLAALKAMLHKRALDFPDDPGRIAYILPRDLPHLKGKRSDGCRFVDVWDDPFRRTLIWLYDGDAYELLRRTYPKAYLELLEDFPLREAVYELIDIANGNASVSELCLLLKQARVVFDDEARWLRENQNAFLVLNLLGERLLRQASAGEEPTTEFKATLAEIVEALIDRPDKTPLGYAWFERLLMSRGHSHRRSSAADASNIDKALLHIAANLSAQLPPHPSPIQWVANQEDVWRNQRIYALLAIEVSRQLRETAVIVNLIEQAVLGDLVSSVGLERLVNGPQSLERIVISNTVAMIPDPAIWFRGLWDRLFWFRDRARGHRRFGHTPTNVGQVVTLWMACGLELLNAGSDDARALWVELESAVREGALTDFFRQHNDICSQTVRFLGGVWRKTFPDDPQPGTPGSLDDFIAPWLNVNADFGLLVVILRRYDVQPGRLGRAGVTGDLLRHIIKDATSGRRSILSEEEVAVIGKLAEELDAVFISDS